MDSNLPALKSQIANKKTLLNDNANISITQILGSDKFQNIINGLRAFRERIFTPMVTLLLFIKQVLNPDKFCKKTVADFIAEQLTQGAEILPSNNTGPYSKARQRLPEETVQELVKLRGLSASEKAEAGW